MKCLFRILIIFFVISCRTQNDNDTKDTTFEYYYQRTGGEVQELKLKFNPTKTEITEAYYKPIGEKNYIPLQIISKNDTPFYYLVNYTELNQVIRLFTDFGAGASLYFSNDKLVTFNKEFKIYSDDKKSVLITSGLPSFTPFFLTDDKNTFIHQFLPSGQDSLNVVTNPDYPNSIVFEGSFTNGKNAKITVFQDPNNPSLYNFIVEFGNEKLIFKQTFQ
ncbi:MAG: hypothetical protein KatS3mg035_1661 [Bacteroidia bacterium]|nr:MAG: hypothetical protein KatS3mg035_1661 [Bacteroidia bacterium]